MTPYHQLAELVPVSFSSPSGHVDINFLKITRHVRFFGKALIAIRVNRILANSKGYF